MPIRDSPSFFALFMRSKYMTAQHTAWACTCNCTGPITYCHAQAPRHMHAHKLIHDMPDVILPCKTPIGTFSATPTAIDAYIMYKLRWVLVSCLRCFASFFKCSVCSPLSTSSPACRSRSCLMNSVSFSTTTTMEMTLATQ